MALYDVLLTADWLMMAEARPCAQRAQIWYHASLPARQDKIAWVLKQRLWNHASYQHVPMGSNSTERLQ